ncbi:Down syndrome cell adhesion molecule-like protein 1 [Trichogramma pretiosum]|uniref:Down syndrome cell adhesion molecule-like protein 1 n=1 Tax=Trichogramma pretiosum TaxID=7493 RepID=UPI0006C93CD0|nr:Down syndrome cell adhesion molecule-like protein 1 [Trichogramma pretiosum]
MRLYRALRTLLLLLGSTGPRLSRGSAINEHSVALVKSYENDTVLLPCHVEDLGLQTRVRWYRGGVLLADSEEEPGGSANASESSSRVKMWGNRSLEIVQVRPEDSGEYVCQASRPEPWGHVTQVHQIQVMYPASSKPVPESGQVEVSLGEEAVLECETHGVPKPSLAWKFQGEELPVLTSGQKLKIHATNRSLAGLYTCEASNGIGEPAAANIELRIKHKPEVRSKSAWLHTAPGIRAQLDCRVTSWPEARLDWLLDGEPLARSQRLLRYKQEAAQEDNSQIHSLVIRSVRAQDLGTYTCRATNELGAAEATSELSGLAKPPLLKRELRASSANSVNFIWEVDSYSPIVEYQFWFRQYKGTGEGDSSAEHVYVGQRSLDSREDWRRLFIPSSNEAASDGPLYARSFNLTGLQPSSQYEALVLVRNRFGWSSPSKVVRFTTDLSTTAIEDEDYKIDVDGHDNIPSAAVQATSDSQRSSEYVNSTARLYSKFATLTLIVMVVASS